jgi:hypothetical protein
MKLCVEKGLNLAQDWNLHHDNAPAHKALFVKKFMAQKFITEMKPPSHSPHLDTNNLWLFPKIKSALKE